VWRAAAAGEAGLLISLGDSISPAILARVLALDRRLQEQRPKGLISTVPSYASVLCRFDPDHTDAATLEAEITSLSGQLDTVELEGRHLEVPVRYQGPDLDRVSGHTGRSVAEVIEIHSGAEYLVYCLGFAPGFTYCGELPPALETPRLSSPRTRVAAGSVGIAGRQTGIYAVESPGGWNLIGQTELKLFDPDRDPPCFFKPGDRVRFRPVR
jgi:KipI family sensor histidine kinase inhibitor